MQKPARLKVVDPLGLEKSISLEKPVFTVGRQTGNDLQLLSGMVSRQHFEIVYENDTYYLLDKDSKSGTYVNRQRITRHPLHHLDRISVGLEDNYSIQFIDETSPVASSISSSGFSIKLARPEVAVSAAPKEELEKLLRFVEVNQAFNFSLSPDDVLCLIVDVAIEMTNADRGFLMLKNATGELEVRVARDCSRRSLSENAIDISRPAVEETLRENRSVIVTDRVGSGAPGANLSQPRDGLHTVACIPLQRFQMSEKMDATSLLRREVIGVLYVDSTLDNNALSKTSVTLLESLAFEASKSLESVRLMREEQEKQRYEREFAMAAAVQVALLPPTFRQRDNFEIAAQSIPCRHVGGDFYDLITMKDGRVVMTLGDVSGKGISAALLASMAQGVIQALLYSGQSLAEVMTNLNRVLVQKSASDRFITLFCGLLDEDKNFSYVNAGHNPPILIRTNGRKELLSTQSMVLGAFDFAQYSAGQTKLDPGDVIMTFTDGVTEAVNASNEMFGEERLENLVRENAALSAESIRDRVLEEVLAFTRGLPQGDDITLMVLRMRSPV